jgi:hypothetical protein
MLLWWLVLLATNAALLAYAFSLRKRPRARRALRYLALACGSLLLGSLLLGAWLGLHGALEAVDGRLVAPSQKAHALGEAISRAMNCAAFGLFGLLLPTVAAWVLCLRAPKLR